jgi:hypothetical protein
MMQSDKAVLEGLIALLHFVGSREHTFFFLNESWTLHSKLAQFQPVATPHVVAVAAVGNTGDPDINKSEIEFARRWRTQRDVIAVLNMDPSGLPQCQSSQVVTRGGDSMLVVGYDGRIGPADCATSFAAPRVAWLLAAAEAVRSSTLGNDDEWLTWVAELVRASRVGGNGLGALRFSQDRLVSYLRSEGHATKKAKS